ncbi:MAG: PadR family transcriptional regulator, partial [Candidatus Dormibacteria bacterium]
MGPESRLTEGRGRSPALELAILGLLKEQHLHGYELKKRLVDTLGFASAVSFGSLYPALGRLESEGAIEVVGSAAPRVAIPLTGSLAGELAAFRARSATIRGGRGKKVYGITPAGAARFEALLAVDSRQPGDDDRLFNLKLSFARYLPAEVRIGLLERRRSQL